MITPMTKYSFILLSGDQHALVERIQEIGLVDITRSVKPVDEHSRNLSGEVELLDGLIRGLRLAQVPEDVTPEHIDGDIVRLTGGMLMRYSEDREEIKALSKEVENLRIWGEFDHTMVQELAQAGVPLHFHALSQKLFQPEWEKEYALTIVNSDKSTVWFVVAGEDSLPGEVPMPGSSAAQKEAELKEKEMHFRKVLGRIAGAKQRLGELESLRSGTYAQLDRYLAGAAAAPAAENTIVTLVGYAPTEDDATVSAALDATGVFYFKDAARVEDNPPIRLQNNWFTRQFEVLTDMYGRPAYDGFDPTPFISLFFLLFFAFCMGDCGYGLVLVLVGLLLRKVKSFKDLAPLVMVLGAGTTVIGFLFHTFFSLDISTWSIFQPIKGIFLPSKIAGYDGTMVLALVVGVVHLCLALCVKTYEQTRNKGFLNSLGSWGWTLLIVGGTLVGALALAGVLDKALTKWIVIAIGVLSALGIFVFNDMGRNKLANVGVGLWDTYNTATGLLGDVLSYLRLYALGLAGSMLGMAFNNIANMVLGDGSNYFLWIPFALIVIVGHTLNVAMAALGAFVHPLRLNFLEFFKNSGYEAAGRNFNPLSK